MIRIKPPRIAFACLAAGILLHVLIDAPRLIPFPYNHLGWSVIVAGLAMMFWSWRLFQDNDAPILPTETPTVLIGSGPFRFSRNPMYLAALLMLLGAAVILGSLPALFAPLAFFTAMNAVHIPFEERSMEGCFGEEYLAYKSEVRRWI